MDRSTLETLLASGTPDYEIANVLGALDGPKAGDLLWEVIAAGDHPMAAAFRLWRFLRGADQAVIDGDKFLALLSLHGRLLEEDEEVAELERGALFGGKANGNHPWWHRDLDEILEPLLERDESTLVDGWSEVDGKLGQGLGWALARRGLVDAEALSDELVDEIARDITFNGASKKPLEQAATGFAEQQERLGSRLASFGAQRGASTKYALWWPQAIEFSDATQRARWVLNLEGKDAAKQGLAFARERFGDEEVDAIVETLVAEKDEPTDYNRPTKRPHGGSVAAVLIGERAIAQERFLEDDELTAFEVGFKPLDGLFAPLAQALGALADDVREEFVLAQLDTPTAGRWKLLRAVMTPATLGKLVDEAREAADNAHSCQSMLRDLQSIPLSERGPLVEWIVADDSAPEFLADLTVAVDYVDDERARQLAEEADRYLVDQNFSFSPMAEQTMALLKARGAWAQKVTYAKTNVYQPDAKDLFAEEPDGAVVIAEVDSNSAISAGRRGLPVVTSETFRALAGPPLADFRERLLARVRAAREMQELVHLHIGEPASEELIERVESEVLGFEMPEALANFYRQMNGFSVYMPLSDDQDKLSVDRQAPLPDCHDEFVPWDRFAARNDESLVFPDAFERKKQSTNPNFYIGVACVLPLEAMFFEHDWEQIRYGQPDIYLFDAFDDFKDAALRVRRESQQVDVLLTSDHGADLYNWQPLGVEAYLEGVLSDYFGSRLAYKRSWSGSVTTGYVTTSLD